MRILVHHRIASRDGQSVHLEELTDALRRQGHAILIVGPKSFANVGFGASITSINILKNAIPKPAFEFLEIIYNMIAFWRLYFAVLKFKPDVIYERFSLFLYCGMWIGKLLNIPVVLEVNSPLFEERLATKALSLKKIGRWSQGWIFRQANAVLPVTEVLAEIAHEYGARPEQVFVIPNGVNLERFRNIVSANVAKELIGLPPRLIVGFVGFIREWNAVNALIKFASICKEQFNIHILIVGDGPARSAIENDAVKMNITDRITITGVVERDDVSKWLNAIDIAVLPAVTSYSSPLKLFEYMELGRAIIAPDLPNIREILTDQVNALLFSDKDGEIERILERICADGELRIRLGQNARETIRRCQLTWDGNASRVGEIIQSLLVKRQFDS